MTSPESVLVTGAAGFIGSTLTDRLLAEGRQVIALDSFDPFYPKKQKEQNIQLALKSPHFKLINGDIRDAKLVRSILSKYKIDGVVHLAALAGVRPSLKNPAAYVDVNINGTTVLLQECAAAEISRIVFASSSSVYGERSEGPFKETDRVERPISPYAATKRGGELIAHTFHPAYGISITCARIFTAYGPRQRPDLAIRKFSEMMLKGEAIPIYGDGSNLRDFTFVDDLVEGLVRALNKDLGFSILNFGAGRMVSVLEVIEILEKELQIKAIKEWLPLQVGDVARTWADIRAAEEALDYDPPTAIEAGIAQFVTWLRA